ncbi:hypothetical protein B9Z55_003347 [Caenorhabditis nigoni]|uniref:PAN-3 domain-containing protein n=1 Tax=Caenorhabditis nigoni TaxID=1611254 RepID=A0A2G5VQ77_9PELO|nr:hypothetical protein B9Z55_003347 [Caenorhabditis nigoni]
MILPLLLLFSWFTSYLPLMITSNGSPQDYGNYSNLNFTFEECVDYCNQEERCMFVKRTVPSNQPTVVDSCRTSPIFKGVLSGLETPEEFDYVKEMADFFFNDTVKATFGMWLGGVRKPECIGNSSCQGIQVDNVYARSGTLVYCGKGLVGYSYPPTTVLQFVTNSACKNQTDVAASCRTSMKGNLSGLDTPEEFEFVKTKYLERGYSGTGPLFGTWLDGVRKPECIGNSSCQGIQAFSFSDPTLSENPTGYLWNPNQPDGNSNDCLAWIMNPDGSYGVSDFPCMDSRSSDNSTCFYGYMCGIQPA